MGIFRFRYVKYYYVKVKSMRRVPKAMSPVDHY